MYMKIIHIQPLIMLCPKSVSGNCAILINKPVLRLEGYCSDAFKHLVSPHSVPGISLRACMINTALYLL